MTLDTTKLLTPLASVVDVPAGWVLAVELGARRLAVVNDGGDFRVLDGHCSHASGPLGNGRLSDGCLTCPWHEARFDVRTGEPSCGPARRALRTYPSSVRDGVVYAALD